MSLFGYNTSSWTGLAGYFYTADSSASYTLNTTVAGTDMANVVPQCGVYMINGTSTGVGTSYPIPLSCSIANLNIIGSNKIDDGYVLYPNFGIQTFQEPNYAGTASIITYNTTSQPLFLGVGTESYGTGVNQLLTVVNPATVYSTGPNVTQSVKVFYQGNEVTISGLS